MVCFFIRLKMYLRSLLFVLVSLRIWVALRKQSSFRIRIILCSIFSWMCLALKSVTLKSSNQYIDAFGRLIKNGVLLFYPRSGYLDSLLVLFLNCY